MSVGGSKTGDAEELERVRTQLRAVQSELESFKQASSAEEREKAEILTAEKKARNQVSHQMRSLLTH